MKNYIVKALTNFDDYEVIATIISKDGSIVDDVPIRKESYNAQAPQAFHLKEIIDAHEEMRSYNPEYRDIIDSCTLYRKM